MTFAPFRRRVVHERRVGSWSIMVPRWRGPDVLDIDDFSQAVARIYDASVSVERWDDALKFLAGLFDSQKAQISYYTSVHDHSPFVRLWGSRVEDFERAFRTYIDMTASDPRAPPRSFKAYHCRQIVSDETLWSSPMYRQALAPAGIEYAMYFTLDLEEATCAAGVMRGPGQAPYTVDDCNDFGRFIPHISRAVMMFGTRRRGSRPGPDRRRAAGHDRRARGRDAAGQHHRPLDAGARRRGPLGRRPSAGDGAARRRGAPPCRGPGAGRTRYAGRPHSGGRRGRTGPGGRPPAPDGGGGPARRVGRRDRDLSRRLPPADGDLGRGAAAAVRTDRTRGDGARRPDRGRRRARHRPAAEHRPGDRQDAPSAHHAGGRRRPPA